MRQFIQIQQDTNHKNANLPFYVIQWYTGVFNAQTTLGNVNVMFNQEDQ